MAAVDRVNVANHRPPSVPDAPPQNAGLDPIFETYLTALRRRRRSDATLHANTRALKAFDKWLNEDGLRASELSLLVCEQHFADLTDKWAAATVRQHLAAVRAAYHYAIRHDLTDRDPTADVKLPRLPDIEPETYTNHQLRTILAAVRNEREELLFHLYAFAGLRLCEVAGLTWQQVDTANQQIKLVGKGGKLRLVPLHPILDQVLDEHRQRANPAKPNVIVSYNHRGRLDPISLARDVRALVDRAYVPVKGASHAFRKTVATNMHEQGIQTGVIDKIMGWAPRTVRDRHYIRIADHTMHQAIQTLYQDDPITHWQRQPPPDEVYESDPIEQLRRDVQRLAEIERKLRR